MLTCLNVQKTHYLSNTVHYCRSSMPHLRFVFYQVPPSDKRSLLWLANWPRALWLAEYHKPRRKCNAPFHNRKLQLSKLKTLNNVLSFTISSSPKEEHGLYPKSPPIPSNSALFEGTAILSGVRNHSGCSRVHSFNPTMHHKNECTTDVHSTIDIYVYALNG